jgi:hypothetical protein
VNDVAPRSGFLTPFDVEDYAVCLTRVLNRCSTMWCLWVAHSAFFGSENGLERKPQWPSLGGGGYRHQGWFGLREAASDLQLWGMRDLPVDDEAHLLFSCPASAVARRERQFSPLTPLQDLMCSCDA